ncbi:MAG: hypothetical protein ACODAJ_04335 [Planctomycetota bacterium]
MSAAIRRPLLAVLVLACCPSVLAGQAAEADLQPGSETRIEAPRSGGCFVVYVPCDYRPDRRWPVIFCYHGLNGKPTAQPFRRVLGGEGFVIVGLEYLVRGTQRLTIPQLKAYIRREAASLERVMAWVAKHLEVDPSMYFVGGFSKGGWTTSGILETVPRKWAGAAILGAARQYFSAPADEPRALRGKPVYIGCGTEDGNYPHARKAVRFYRDLGARVTFEPYAGLGHEMKWDTEKLPQWLYAHGPRRDLEGRLAAARKAEQTGKLGVAYSLYHELSLVSEQSELCRSAGEAAGRLAERAEALLAEAEKAVAEKRYADAPRPLARVTSRYEGSPFAERADALIRKLQSDPTIQDAIRQAGLDAAADQLEARARAAEKDADYVTAFRLYEQYMAQHPQATRYEEVKAHFEGLKANKALRAKVLDEQAARQCRVWLNLADNYARAGMPAKARAYLRKILTKHDGTDWAAKARDRLAALEP